MQIAQKKINYMEMREKKITCRKCKKKNLRKTITWKAETKMKE